MNVDTIRMWLDANLQNPYWRLILIIAAAVVVGVLARMIVLPVVQRITRRTASKIDDQIVGLIWPAVFRSIILEGVHIAVLDFVASARLDVLVSQIVGTLMVIIWGRVLLGAGTLIFQKLSDNADRYAWIQPQTLPLYQFAYKVVVFGLLVYMLMAAWSINLTSWLASAGVMGIAIGFAAKDTLANFISGVFILADSPYQVGQYIIIDGDTRGVVTDIGIRSTRLVTRDNVEVTVPNAVIGNAKIVNESSGPSLKMRVTVQIGVAYGSDVDKVREILTACVADLPHTVDHEAAVIRFAAMGESSLDYLVMVWVRHPVYRGRVIDELNTRIYKALAAAGIEIPFPQRDLHIKHWPSPPPA
jgi:small-conductance mechanosensitive channel